MGDVPLYILTGRATGSAAEDFSYIMKAHNKAKLVGSRTAGAGHTVAFYPVAPAFVIGISNGRPISPVTGEGWEGVGVQPHVDVVAGDALDKAKMLAFENLISESDPGADISAWEWGLTSLEGKANPPKHTIEELDALTGTYGARTILRKDDTLYYTRDGRPEVELTPLTKTLFEHSVMSDFRLRFIFQDDKNFVGDPAVVLEALFANGRRERDPRSL